jgi:hypothetical protein
LGKTVAGFSLIRWGKAVVIDVMDGFGFEQPQHFIGRRLVIFALLIETETAALLPGSTSISQVAVNLRLKSVYRGNQIYLN